MKTLYSIILIMLISMLGYAQVPEAFSYQALIRNGSGDILASSQVAVQISILQDSESGSAVYVETFNPTTTQYGLIALKLGKGSVQSGTFNAIDWGAHAYYVKIEVDPNNGTDYTHMGTSQLLAVPYAMYSNSAADVFSGDYNDLSNAPTAVSVFSNDAGYLTSFSETDPVFGAHAANGITAGNITNWNEAHGWGDHAAEGYLKSFTETDPVFGAHAANGIAAGDISHWDEAYGWGNHGTEGYITDGNTNWDNSYGFITDGNTNWNNSYGFITAGSTITGLIRSTASGNSWITGGNVGIGRTTPGAMLEVYRNSGSYMQTNLADGRAYHTLRGGSNTWTAGLSHTSDGGYWYMIESNNNSYFQLHTSGILNIYADPVYLRETYDNPISSGRDLYISSSGELGYLSSSMKYKTNVRPMGDYSSRIFDLSPVLYDAKNGDEKDLVGLIAEDVEKVMPELVSYNEEGEIETVYYSKLVPILLNEIIKLKTEIDIMRQKLED